jgi:selenocysteine-specific elongation factor
MKVLGTAGHVDHGKSALVLALSGINPDRLQEEIDRQMTIDLGFAWMKLPNGEEVGIVDVPGHRDFIENMLAGVDGFDAALLVVAADEGIMPQTREHLAILDLLGIDRGVVAITKIDLLDDPEWLDLVEEDIERFISNTSLSDAPIIPVSAKSGAGLDDLKLKLSEVLEKTNQRVDVGRPRLPVDRSFTISGFGTVVTGTLKGGHLSVGDEVEILPASIKGRIRGVQTHKTKVNTATPGSRTAANISGVEVGQVVRGDVVAHPNTYAATSMIDVQYRHIPGSNIPIKHDQRVKIFVGSAQRTARVRVLGTEEIQPGEMGFLQLMIDDPIVAERGDHYILRRPSPGFTLGGGRVVDAFPQRRHRRFDQDTLNSLRAMASGEPSELIVQTLKRMGITTVGEVIDKTGLAEREALETLVSLVSSGDIVALTAIGDELGRRDSIAHKSKWVEIVEHIDGILGTHHKEYPLRSGMPREELKSKLNVDNASYSMILKVLSQNGIIRLADASVAKFSFKPTLSQNQVNAVDQLLSRFAEKPYSTPSVKETVDNIGEEIYNYLLGGGKLIAVSSDVVFRRQDYEAMVEMIKSRLGEKESLTVAEVRDMFDTTRKYALALMEYLDSIGITVRIGDARQLASR